MKKFLLLCLAFVAMHAHTSPVAAELIKTLAGTWMLDVTASEQSMLRARPFQNTEAFMMMPPMGLMFFKFDGDRLLTGSLPDVGDAVQFRRAGISGGDISYVSTRAPTDIVLVAVLSENKISITYPLFPASQYFLWQRVQLDPSKKTPSDFRPEFDAYMAMLNNLWVAFGFSTGSPTDVNRSAR